MGKSKLRGYPLCPKGTAMAMHERSEYEEGRTVWLEGKEYTNPYDPWDEYESWYAWDIGYQSARNKSKELTNQRNKV